MPEIKMIVSDVDGTLVDRTEQIPEELVTVVRRCQENGIIFALSTGRTFELAQPFVEKLNIIDPCVEANGAYIIRNGECMIEHGFSLAPVQQILQQAHDAGLTVTISDTKEERATSETDYVREHKQFGNRFRELRPLESIDWKNDRFQKVMIMDEHHTGKIEHFRELLEHHADKYWITTYSNQAVELGPKDCNKASGVRELATMLGIEMNQVMACGDFWNDYEMITQVGWGVAVGNALPELKEAAKYVATKPYAHGVIEAIRVLCFHETP